MGQKQSAGAKRKISIKRILILLVMSLVSLTVLGLSLAWFLVTQPVLFVGDASDAQVDAGILEKHVRYMCEECYPRDFGSIANLDRCADYIRTELKKAGCEVSYQEYEIEERTYRNVIGKLGGGDGEVVVVGAHYDGCGTTTGADDNASGVAVLLELASLLGAQDGLKHPIELVAYTLEEPPYFGGTSMGSWRHASSLKDAGIDVKAMICLEMVGYYSDEPDSQLRPSPMLELLYPDTGNFIAIVGEFGKFSLVRRIKKEMIGAADLPVLSVNVPTSVQGVDFSDHRNYWYNGWDAVMITDTSMYRNQHYHGRDDTPDTLDYEAMAKLTAQVFEAVKDLAED